MEKICVEVALTEERMSNDPTAKIQIIADAEQFRFVKGSRDPVDRIRSISCVADHFTDECVIEAGNLVSGRISEVIPDSRTGRQMQMDNITG